MMPPLRCRRRRRSTYAIRPAQRLATQRQPRHAAAARAAAAEAASLFHLSRRAGGGDAAAGRLHNPEFTLLEWYRPDYDHRQLMTEVAELVTHLLENRVPLGAA